MSYLSKFQQYTSNGLRELSEHPIRYPINATKDLIVDYWDLCGSFALGVAINDYQNKILGDMTPMVKLFGGLAAIIGPAIDNQGMVKTRAARNVCAALTGVGVSELTSPEVYAPLIGMIMSVIMGPTTMIFEDNRIKGIEIGKE